MQVFLDKKDKFFGIFEKSKKIRIFYLKKHFTRQCYKRLVHFLKVWNKISKNYSIKNYFRKVIYGNNNG